MGGMTLFPRRLGVLVVLALAGGARGESDIDRLVRALAAGHYETRWEAARALARGGAEEVESLRGAYRGADFRTRALVLDAFRAENPGAGIPLLREDPAPRDRSVVRAQRQLVSAVYGEVREAVRREVLPLVPEREWGWEEGLRALPGREPAARAALARLLAGGEPGASRGRRIASLVARVDAIRAWTERLAREGSPREVRWARGTERRLLRHDVERALLAVYRSGGRDGNYRGIHAVVGEVGPAGGWTAVDVLLLILKDEPAPEEGVDPPPGGGYRFLEPLGVDLTPGDMRFRAAACLGDIGDLAAGRKIAEYFVRVDAHWRRLESGYVADWRDLYRMKRFRESLALACARLGQEWPLLGVMEEILRDRYPDEDQQALLAEAFSRLGRDEEAVRAYRRLLRYERIYYDGVRPVTSYNLACALSRLGRLEEALEALRAAFRAGYGEDPRQVVWMDRDADLAALRATPEYRRFRASIGR